MAREVQRPIFVQIRPPTRGLNSSKDARTIDVREASDLMNVRFRRGKIQFRDGFQLKYRGLWEPTIWIDTVFLDTEQALVALTARSMYTESGDVFVPIDVYDGIGSPIEHPQLNIDLGIHYISVDAGTGLVDFNDANAGEPFFGEITVITTGAESGIFALAYTGIGSNVEAELLTEAPTYALSVAMFANRVFVGGTETSKAEVVWSAPGNFSEWDPGINPGAGAHIIGDSPDWIQAMRRLGEYLIVYKERSIYIGSETFQLDPPVRFIPAPGQGIGLAAPNSIGDLGEEHIFVGWDNVYMFSLKEIIPIGDRIREELFYGEDGIIPRYLGNCTGVIAEEFSEYWLFIPTGKSPETTGGDPIVNEVPTPTMAGPASSVWSGPGDLIDGGTYGPERVELEPLEYIYDSVDLEPGTYTLTGYIDNLQGVESTIRMGFGTPL